MKTRTIILALAAVSFLAGCASNMYWGPALITYGSGSAETFASGASRNAAEYETARQKHKQTNDESATDETGEAEEIEEVTVDSLTVGSR